MIFVLIVLGCKSNGAKQPVSELKQTEHQADFVIAFGSCNKPSLENSLWDDISAQKPDAFIWGGDIVYADTEDVVKIQQLYDGQDTVSGYAILKKEVFITGTWDDHDYGANDAGVEFIAKDGSQQAFLNLLDVPEDDERRTRQGVYSSQLISKAQCTVKILNLDTGYF